MLWICSQHFSATCETLLCHDSLCCLQYEGSRPRRQRRERERDRQTDRQRDRERCSSEAQPHLLFMTHRKSFSTSSRWYPGSKHNTQAVRGTSQPDQSSDSEAGRGQQGVVAGCGVHSDVLWVWLSIFMLVFLFMNSPPSPPLFFLFPAPPKFTKIPTDQIGVSGGVASFVCQANGSPKPVVYWNKKGKKVNSQRIEVVVTVLNGYLPV